MLLVQTIYTLQHNLLCYGAQCKSDFFSLHFVLLLFIIIKNFALKMLLETTLLLMTNLARYLRAAD